MRSPLPLLLPATGLALVILGAPAGAAIRKGAAVEVSHTATIHAAPSRVWARLCSAEGLGALGGLVPRTGSAPMARVGDHLSGVLAHWNDPGTLVCTCFKAGRELRASWEPDNGSYLCRVRVVVEAAGTGSRVTLTDTYTDDQAATVDKTARESDAEMASRLASFKAMAEKP
ncbi:MAG: hypothetical protein HZB25_06690 [Candidatus Eisenbacteria bacterium]|nr:hypothetical protein [Candidatus Eisenbacteria bacterium]